VTKQETAALREKAERWKTDEYLRHLPVAMPGKTIIRRTIDSYLEERKWDLLAIQLKHLSEWAKVWSMSPVNRKRSR
jgi:hypothetical protein